MSGWPVQVLGLSMNGCSTTLAWCGAWPLFDAQRALASPAQPEGLPGEPGRKRSLSFSFAAGNPQTEIAAPASGIDWVMPETVIRRP